MSTANHRVAILERRLSYLNLPEHARNAMAQREVEALQWALPLLRAVAARDAPRRTLGDPCPVCRTPAGFICAHLPSRT